MASNLPARLSAFENTRSESKALMTGSGLVSQCIHQERMWEPAHPKKALAEERISKDLPNKVLRCDDASGDSVAKGVQLNSLVRLEVLLSQKDVEVGVFLD